METAISWTLSLLFLGVCLFLNVRLKMLPVRYLGYSLHLALQEQSAHAQGEISSFQSLILSQALTLCMSCFTGISSAILIGGYGAIFWIALFGLLGVVVKFSEGLLAVKYRSVNHRGEICGGPMYYIAHGWGKKALGFCFALFGVLIAFFMGASNHAQALSHAAQETMHCPGLVTGLILILLLVPLFSGGAKRIAKVCTYVLSSAFLIYCACVSVLFLSHLDSIPRALHMLLTEAFSQEAVFGGIAGSSLLALAHYALTWSMVSHHAGSGVASMATAAAQTDVPGRQALMSAGMFFLCIVLNVMTAVAIFVAGDFKVGGGQEIMQRAFCTLMPRGDLLIKILFFVLSFISIALWGYFGENCALFLQKSSAKAFRLIFCACVLVGCQIDLSFLSPYFHILSGGLFAIHLIALAALTPVISIESRLFFDLIEIEKRREKPLA